MKSAKGTAPVVSMVANSIHPGSGIVQLLSWLAHPARLVNFTNDRAAQISLRKGMTAIAALAPWIPVLIATAFVANACLRED